MPDAVNLLTLNNHRVIVQSGVGEIINFLDREYSDAGAEIVENPEEVYDADIILKVSPPTQDEISFMKNNQTLISALQLEIQSPEFFRSLMKKTSLQLHMTIYKTKMVYSQLLEQWVRLLETHQF